MTGKKNDRRTSFDAQWKLKPFKSRAVKIMLDFSEAKEEEKKLIEVCKRYQAAVNRKSNIIVEKLKNGELTTKQVSRPRDSKFAKTLWDGDEAYYEGEIGFYFARWKRATVFHAMRFYRGYSKRNKTTFPKKTPQLRKNISINIEDGVITHIPNPEDKTKGWLLITIYGQSKGKDYPKIKVPYNIPKGMADKRDYIGRQPGGTLKLTKQGRWIFTARAKVEFKWAYEPVGQLGSDFNQTSKYFVTLSEVINFLGATNDIIGHNKKIKEYQVKLKELNKEMRTKLPYSKKKGIRKKLKKTHLKMEKECLPYCEAILKHVVDNKLLLCIDPLKCGARTGSFGQDKMVDTLTKLCENRCIPFVWVPTPHTSKCCCDCMHEAIREKNPEHLTCLKCGKKNAHKNATGNSVRWGKIIWEKGSKEFEKWKAENFIRLEAVAAK